MASLESESDSQSSFYTILKSLSDSISGALSSLPSKEPHDATEEDISILAPTDGISLLDTKNELILSYLQNMVFLFLLQIRHLSKAHSVNGQTDPNPQQEEVVKKLTELRIFLEKGVRPLEGRLKYQVDKVLKAAEDAERARQSNPGKKQKSKREQIGSDSEEDSSANSGNESGSGQSSDKDEEIDELVYRPNLAAFSKTAKVTEEQAQSIASKSADGIYRPPKIKPTALPADFVDRRSARDRPAKSRVIDEFVSAEMSAAPMAEPSIGSTIRAGGREVRTQRDREKEMERRTYEETNFVRLPKESKKDRAKQGGKRQGGFGGEDWRSLGEGADRIERLTRRGKSSGGALERSRKRRLTEDGPRGDGVNVGEGFEKRRKKVEGWKK